jgi:ribosomal protein L16 Arg81 hydroxylase
MAEEADRSHTCPESVVWDGVLSPGQILHVPRGWWHTVRGVGGWSMHLTFGVTRATGMSWMRWFLDQLIDDPHSDKISPGSPLERSAQRTTAGSLSGSQCG